MRSYLRRIGPAGAVALWLVVCVGGMAALVIYSNTPGEVGEPADGWPVNSVVELDETQPTLVLFAHPRCPCTRATFSELERLQHRSDVPFTTRIIFYEPDDADDQWRETHLWERARALPNATAHADPAGRLITQFGAVTSGTAALYSTDGSLLYWGGLTAARGHEGDSVGSLALREHIDGRATDLPTRCTVYGCSLRSPNTIASVEVTDENR